MPRAVYVYICTHLQMYEPTRVWEDTCSIYTYLYVYICTYSCVCLCACIHPAVVVSRDWSVYTYICVYPLVCWEMYSVYAHMGRERDKHTHVSTCNLTPHITSVHQHKVCA